jgi:MYXO-CTERM domain-containing protein
MKVTVRILLSFALAVDAAPAHAAPASSITQYGVTWTFDKAYETGQFVTGDYWVVGPAKIVSVSPAPTGTRNGSCVNPKGGRQGYDSRGGEFKTDDQVSFPYVLVPDQSLVSSVSKPEGASIQNAGDMVSQAFLTAVASPPAAGSLRPSFAGTFKRYFNASQVAWSVLPKLPAPSSAPKGTQLLAEADRPRADHLSSWTIQNSCAEENWNNGPGEHACYGREVSAFVSAAALYVMLDTKERDELALSMIQIGIDNYGILKAGGKWSPNGGHHSGRKWPIVFAARMLNDCEMLAVGKDYDDSHFGEDGQTYFGKGGKALFGWDCGGGQGAYFENGCSGSGAKDCRDPALTVDGCPDYRNCCTSAYWVGQMLSALMLDAKAIWNHDPYFDYVDRWMGGTVDGADGADAFTQAMWTAYRTKLPTPSVPAGCGSGGVSGSGGANGSGAVSGNGGANGSGGVSGNGGANGSGGVSGNGGAKGSGGASGNGGAKGSGGGAGTATGGRLGSGGSDGGAEHTGGRAGDAPDHEGAASEDGGGCGCRLSGERSASGAPWAFVLALGLLLRRRRSSFGHD